MQRGDEKESITLWSELGRSLQRKPKQVKRRINALLQIKPSGSCKLLKRSKVICKQNRSTLSNLKGGLTKRKFKSGSAKKTLTVKKEEQLAIFTIERHPRQLTSNNSPHKKSQL